MENATPQENKKQPKVTTWIFDEGSFRPTAKLVGNKSYSIVTDYLGTPVQAYDETGQLKWETELDIYGKVRTFEGDKALIPFRYQGQYEDVETGLYYNRFRYYSPEEGMYLSQDPIGLAGGNPTIYGYVKDVNSWVDQLGLRCSFDSIIAGKNFKKHFIDHKHLIEKITGKKYRMSPNPKKGHVGPDEFLNDIKDLIDDGTFKYVGEGTIKVDQPVMSIFRSEDVTVVIKDIGNEAGEWVTVLERGKGMDIGIILK